ncbi:hypothetical protein CBR_g16027 [Chara braunii]|uniref:Uncharacterized protein n=1 Tax=Chara braunii TaxID=69332 RepID=A0A388JT19_CHABU|nr:hypothetical protein CBR_g16027 [Chara braunii]|eukprot:GBG60907.1 hypothetical protein CBR_g16027 [Chara braunii]
MTRQMWWPLCDDLVDGDTCQQRNNLISMTWQAAVVTLQLRGRQQGLHCAYVAGGGGYVALMRQASGVTLRLRGRRRGLRCGYPAAGDGGYFAVTWQLC